MIISIQNIRCCHLLLSQQMLIGSINQQQAKKRWRISNVIRMQIDYRGSWKCLECSKGDWFRLYWRLAKILSARKVDIEFHESAASSIADEKSEKESSVFVSSYLQLIIIQR